MITTFYPPHNFGGDGIFVQGLANELANEGHHVEVIHCVDSFRLLAGREPTAVRANHPNVTVHGLKSRFGWLSPLATHQTGDPLFKSSRVEQILERSFDVIHYHNISLIGGPKILEYGRGIKLYTMHEYWLACPTHTLFRFNRISCTHPTCLSCTLYYRRLPQWWRYLGLLKKSIENVDALLSPTRFSKALHERLGFKVPIIHLPNFVPSEGTGVPALEAPKSRTPQEEPYFLFVGRLEKLKGVQTLIPVFRHYPKARLLIAGTGKYESKLRQLAAGSKNIEFLGFRSQQELRSLYRQAIGVIVPSLWFEVFPLVIIEAFRGQTPVLLRNIGGFPEIIQESRGGLLFDTEAELVSALDQLLADLSWQAELGRRGYEAYLKNWTTKAHLNKYLNLIRHIASTSGKSWGKSSVSEHTPIEHHHHKPISRSDPMREPERPDLIPQ
jgi:glycosyltransferase involved in cell wall biosynthesis